MTIPADATKVNFDAGTDDPRAARSEFVSWIDGYNTLLAHARAAPYFANSYTVGEGTEVSGGALRAKVRAAWGIGRDGNGLALDIPNMGAISGDVDPSADSIPIYDAGGSVVSRVAPQGVLQSFTYLTELTAVDSAADKMPVYDVSTATLKWAKPQSLGAGSWTKFGEVNAAGVSAMTIDSIPSTARYLMFIGELVPGTDSVTFYVTPRKGAGTNMTSIQLNTNGVSNVTADGGISFVGYLMQAQAGYNHHVFGDSFVYRGAAFKEDFGARVVDTAVVTGMTFGASAGTFDGNVQLFYIT